MFEKTVCNEVPMGLSLTGGKSPNYWEGMKSCLQRNLQNPTRPCSSSSLLSAGSLNALLWGPGSGLPLSGLFYLPPLPPAFPTAMANVGYKKPSVILSLYFE